MAERDEPGSHFIIMDKLAREAHGWNDRRLSRYLRNVRSGNPAQSQPAPGSIYFSLFFFFFFFF